MWQAVEVEEEDAPPPVGAALGCDPRGDDGGLGRHKVARWVRWRDDNPARIGEPSGVCHRCGERPFHVLLFRGEGRVEVRVPVLLTRRSERAWASPPAPLWWRWRQRGRHTRFLRTSGQPRRPQGRRALPRALGPLLCGRRGAPPSGWFGSQASLPARPPGEGRISP